jgi:hypothetical protein
MATTKKINEPHFFKIIILTDSYAFINIFKEKKEQTINFLFYSNTEIKPANRWHCHFFSVSI